MEREDLIPGKEYRNIKHGHKYKLLGLAKHSETLEDMVSYEALYDTEFKCWVRPLDLFLVKFEPWDKR